MCYTNIHEVEMIRIYSDGNWEEERKWTQSLA